MRGASASRELGRQAWLDCAGGLLPEMKGSSGPARGRMRSGGRELGGSRPGTRGCGVKGGWYSWLEPSGLDERDDAAGTHDLQHELRQRLHLEGASIRKGDLAGGEVDVYLVTVLDRPM